VFLQTSMPVFGIDANALTRAQRTGVERYVSGLINHMKAQPLNHDERVVLYASGYAPEFADLPAGWHWKKLSWPFALGWTHGRLSFELMARTPDVFFTPAHELPLDLI